MRTSRPLAFADHLAVPRRPMSPALKTLLVLGAGVALIMFLTNCSPNTNSEAQASAGGCTQDSQCATGVCVNGQCQECRADSECSDGELCQGNRCEMATAATCQCAPGEICDEQGACVADPDQLTHASSVSDLPVACRPSEGASQELSLNLINFEFNESTLTPESQEVLVANAECLRVRPHLGVVVEGHCDERGTQEFNLALGERRAAAVKSFLVNLGIDSNRIRTLSKGENEPLCESPTDACYAKNRRAEFRVSGGERPLSRADDTHPTGAGL